MPSISKVLICNMSLSNIGAKSTIESITELSTEAKACNLWYDFSLKQALEAFNWSFARKRFTLAAHGDDAPEDIWAYRYQYPSDCVAAREIVNPAGKDADAVPFEVQISDDGTKSILTNLDDAELIYTFLQENTTMFSAHFVEMFSYILAAHISFSITGKRTIKGDMLAMARSLLRVAPAQNAREATEEPIREAEWIRGR